MMYLGYIWRLWRLKRTVKKLEKARFNPSKWSVGNVSINLKRLFAKITPNFWRLYLKRRQSESVIFDRFQSPFRLQILLQTLTLFLFGLFLALMFHFFAFYFLLIDRVLSAYICGALAVIFSLGLAFSQRFRCITFLAIPQIFTGKGRAILLAYVIIAANNGILKNSMKNAEIFVNSSICLQNKLVDLLPPPIAKELKVARINASGIDAFKQRKKSFKDSYKKLKTIFKSIDKVYNETWKEIQKKYTWLKDKESLCRKFKNVLTLYVDELVTRLYSHWAVLTLAHWLPHILKASALKIIDEGFEEICDLDDDGHEFFSLQPILGIRFKTIKQYVKQQLNLDVKFHHHYVYDLNPSKSMKQLKKEIWEDIQRSFDIPIKIIRFLNLLLSGFMLFIFIKSWIYYRRFSRSAHYDNYYISKELKLLDSRRGFLGLSTILPLRWRESFRYVSTFSINLVKKERKKLIASFILIAAAVFQVAYYMLLDFTLHRVAVYLNSFKDLTIKIEEPMLPKLRIKGNGLGSIFLRGIAGMFDPFFDYYIPPIDLGQCLPQTIAPNYDIYIKIAWLLLIAIIISSFGAWGLRLRHLIAAHYNPQMERVRAIWLHRKISGERTLKMLLRSRKKFRFIIKNPAQFFEMIGKYFVTRFSFIEKLLNMCGVHQVFCDNCGEKLILEDGKYKECDSSGCTSAYCNTCFEILNNECMICGRPIDYDLSPFIDIDEERDSSDDEFIAPNF